MPGEPEPVATARELADITHRAAAHAVGQLEYLAHCQDRPFRCTLLPRPADTARVTRENLVLLHGRSQHRPEQPVRLGSHGHRHAIAQKAGPPVPDHRRGQLPQRHRPELGHDVPLQQPRIQINRARPEPRTLCDPPGRIVTEPRLTAIRVGPLPREHVRLDQHQSPPRITRPGKCLRASTNAAIRPRIPDLIAAGRQLADIAETPMTILVRHQATPLRRGHVSATVSGSTRPASMNSRTAGSGIRTWRPSFTNLIRRSAIRRRGNRSVVPSSSATSATVRSRSSAGRDLAAITLPSRSREGRLWLRRLFAWLR